MAPGDLVADAQDRRAARAEHDRVALLVAALGLAPAQHAHRLADVLLQQLLGREQVVLVVLLEHAQARAAAQRAHLHGLGLDRARDAGELELGPAARERQRAHLAHQAEAAGVDRDRELLALLGRRDDARRRRLLRARQGRDAKECQSQEEPHLTSSLPRAD
jgi:hypothetical protein